MSENYQKVFAPHVKCPSRSVVTGSWRILKPIISLDKCNSCLLCWVFCPEGVIQRGEKILNIDYINCKGCGICAKECPKGAITMVKEE